VAEIYYGLKIPHLHLYFLKEHYLLHL